jgi:prepilin-type N-terminal cleavage/methylation domain-containing protein
MKKAFTLIEFLVCLAILATIIAILAPVCGQSKVRSEQYKQFTIVTDEYVGGQHIQIIEDNSTHARTKLINDQVVSETNKENHGNN